MIAEGKRNTDSEYYKEERQEEGVEKGQEEEERGDGEGKEGKEEKDWMRKKGREKGRERKGKEKEQSAMSKNCTAKKIKRKLTQSGSGTRFFLKPNIHKISKIFPAS